MLEKTKEKREGEQKSLGRRLQLWAARGAFPIMGVLCVILFWLCYPPSTETLGRWLVSLIVFLFLSGFPSWLYLRFLSVKLTPLYFDFVHSLYRLGVDDPAYLPQPLATSAYHDRWLAAQPKNVGPSTGGRMSANSRSASATDDSETLYDMRFEAYFGRREENDRFTGVGSLLPVIAVWVAFAVGWLAILVNLGFVNDDMTLEDALRFGFMGAYLFSLQLSVRAFFQNDLRSGTYVGMIERLTVVLILVTVIHVAWSALFASGGVALEAVVLFVVGSFPLVGQEWLTQWASSKMKGVVQSIESHHPLSEIDGMNVWYEARLLEEGIEDVQNLATADMVDIVLHSRAPVGRIVDWVDQALLRQHLPPLKADEKPPKHETDDLLLQTLNDLGVRTATDLLELYAPLSAKSVSALHHRLQGLEPKHAPIADFHKAMLEVISQQAQRQAIGFRMLAILRCLGSEPNLQYVLNWQTGAPAEANGYRLNATPPQVDASTHAQTPYSTPTTVPNGSRPKWTVDLLQRSSRMLGV